MICLIFGEKQMFVFFPPGKGELKLEAAYMFQKEAQQYSFYVTYWS